MIPTQTMSTTVTLRAVRSCRRNMSMHPQCDEEQVDELDPEEGGDHAAYAIDQKVALQHLGGAHGLELDPPQGQWDEQHDDEGIENDRRQDGEMGIAEPHDVQCLQGGEHSLEHG